jgi:alpha-tubulin suppressor-like RCC1 family protein
MQSIWRKALSCTALLAAAALAGCGGGSGDATVTAAPAGPAGPTDSATAGGPGQAQAVTLAGPQGAQAVVPPGALAQAMTLRIAADSTGAPAVPVGLVPAGPVIALTPHGAVFEAPVRVRLPVTEAAPADHRAVVAKVSPGGQWQLLEPVDRGDGWVDVEVTSFSYFLVGWVPMGSANASLAPSIGVRLLNPTGPAAGANVHLDAPGDLALGFTLNFAPTCGAPEGWQVQAQAQQLSIYASGGAAPAYVWRQPIALVSTQAGAEHVVRLPWSALQVINNFATPVRVGGPPPNEDMTRTETFRVRDFRAVCPAHGSVAERLFPAGMPLHERFVTAATGNRLFFTRNPVDTQVVVGQMPQFPVELFAAQLGAPGSRINVQLMMASSQGGLYGSVDSQDSTQHPDGRFHLLLRPVTLADHGARLRAVATVVGGPGSGEQVASAEVTLSVIAQSVAPGFSALPRSMMVLSGQTASFSATATGVPAPTLQWQTRPANSNGAWTDVPAAQGGTSATYTTATLRLADNGAQVRVVATNAGGSNESPPVSVSVSEQAVAPTITADLSAIRALRGGDATFAVGVRGTEPLSYEWRVGGQVVAGQNAPVLNLQSVQADATVQVTVSNATGTTQSRTVDLRVFDGVVPEAPVSIDVQPVSLNLASGQTAVFAVRASGGGSLHYRWQYNGQDVAGFPDSPVLMLPNALPGFNGSYRVVVSNATSSATSAAATLQVAPPVQPVPPGFAVQPMGLSLHPGQTATFAAVARGTGAIAYQWLREGAPIVGARQPVLSLPAVAAGDAGSYTVQATDASGQTITSNPAALVVSAAPGLPLYTVQTFVVNAVVGDTPTIAMLAQGAPAPRCFWLKNGAVLPGATNCTGLTLPAVTLADHGSVYTSIAYNEAGTVTGGPAVLNVAAPAAPTITQQPVDAAVAEGGAVDLLALASGSPPPDPQWFVNGQRIPFGTGITFAHGACTVGYDQTGSRLRLMNVPLACNGKVFSFTAVNTLGSATSNPATLTVTAAVPAGALTATQVVAGHEWSLVLRPDRTVWGWGGLHKVDGTVVIANLNPADQARRPVQLYPGNLTDVRQIAGWYDGFWALTGEPGSAASRVLHWGRERSGSDGRGADGAGNLGPITQFRVNAAPVAMLERRSVNGTLLAAPVDRVCSIAATSDRVLMIRALDGFGLPTDCLPGSGKTVWVAGTLTQYGSDAVGVVVPVQGLPAGVPARVIAQQATAQSSSGPMLVLMEDGSAYGWGTNIGNLFGLATPANTGTVGNNVAPQALPGAWGTLRDAAFSYVGLIGLRADGSAMVSGRNDNGELGLGPQPGGTVNNGPLPLLASAGVALDGVQALASAQVQVSLALRQGHILAWGAANQPLQGGSNARIDHPRLLPASGDGWRAISAGNAHALAIAANGAVYTWGNGLRGALGNGVDGGNALAPTLVTTP